MYRGLRLGVEVGGRFVEDEDVGGLQDQAGEGDALFFADAQPVAPFADDGVEPVGQRGDER